MTQQERAACGVGFVASRRGRASRAVVETTLEAVCCVEHRGGFLADGVTGDGCGVMLDIPFELLGVKRGEVAVATLFLLTREQRKALDVFERTFAAHGFEVFGYRQVPIDTSVLGPMAAESMPHILHAFVRWPPNCRTESSFNQQLYLARQRVRTMMKNAGIYQQFFFASLSTSTIVYKALTRAEDLPRFYRDLSDPAFKSRFGIFHRRFSTNTRTAWDKIQPFRLIAHNGEINTIAGNHSSAYSREQALGLPPDELLTHEDVSDSGALNGMVEALKYRSSMPRIEDALAIMIPPAPRSDAARDYYRFWSRAMEAWDGPAFVAYSDGNTVGARLDRNGFRPCRWAMTPDFLYVASEAGVFGLDEREVEQKGALGAGEAVRFDLGTGRVHFRDPSRSRENDGAGFDARLWSIPPQTRAHEPWAIAQQRVFLLTKEELHKQLLPIIKTGHEPIGSMGDTARLAILSDQPRSFFDFFHQTFAQVTNPPLDYLRERMVTDLSVYLGKQPNIFAPKELIPPMPGLLLDSPILSLDDYAYLRGLVGREAPLGQRTVEIGTCFERDRGASGFRARLDTIAEHAVAAVKTGARILLLSDRGASYAEPPLPSLLALRAVVCALNREGLRLECSIVVASGEVRSSHHVAALIGFGAAAVCPVLPLELARFARKEPDGERNVLRALEAGLLKIMSKMGISVVRSYRSAKLFSAIGLGDTIIDRYFRGLKNPVGGMGMNRLAALVLDNTRHAVADPGEPLPSTFLFKEHAKLAAGERHSMTAKGAALLHDALEHEPDSAVGWQKWQRFADGLSGPLHLRDLLAIEAAGPPMAVDAVEPASAILRRFGAGAMSFGAISAEAQRDIIRAMRAIGGRSNSGEGGENPFYEVDGTHASTKQVASARFGVTAQYLAAADEVEIKIAQGAKPGEGGQLMGVKVDEVIARARYASAGVDLISPPPLHDIYSIEDLKQLIFELKQLHPDKPVSVKLVSGVNIGTIAAGVVKAGADIIQISGGSGGTGAASLVSMKHAGLPWEIGLCEVHDTLCRQRLRSHVRLRVDGSMATGEDVVKAIILGADEVGFGKLLMVAEGCVMARVCEKNTCPRGIATHDPKYKAKYVGTQLHVERLMRFVAEDVRRVLARIGASRLEDVCGKHELLVRHPDHEMLVTDRGLDVTRLLSAMRRAEPMAGTQFTLATTPLNQRIVEDVMQAEPGATASYAVRSVDRAVLARVSGVIAGERHAAHLRTVAGTPTEPKKIDARIVLRGSAGQGFAVFLVDGLDVRLEGEANDSVCKSMSGGRVVIVPHPGSPLDAEHSAIIGNCALYGATGGRLFVRGLAGDRFAVRNSGATAVVEGVGLHACGYMTRGTVVILGSASDNVGSGMTGGVLYCLADNQHKLNREYVTPAALDDAGAQQLGALMAEHHALTGSRTAAAYLSDEARLRRDFVMVLPREALQGAASDPVSLTRLRRHA